MEFFYSLFMVSHILRQSLIIYWFRKGECWVSVSRIEQMLVDIRAGLNLAEQSWVFREVKSLNGAWNRYGSGCLSFIFKRLCLDVWYRRSNRAFSLSLSHMYKRMWKKSEIIKKLIFLYPTVIIKHMSFIPCVTHKTSKLNATGSKMFLLKILFIKYTFKMKYSI